jgi:hypothetical protein
MGGDTDSADDLVELEEEGEAWELKVSAIH